MRWIAATPLLAGCSALLGLEAPVLNADARVDGIAADSERAIDMREPCGSSTHDEDGDGTHDDCDACPTVPSDMQDQDADGLPDACDPNLASTGDAILFAKMFDQVTDLVAFDYSASASWSASNNGTVSLAPNSHMKTLTSLAPNMIEVRVVSLTGSETGRLELRAPSVTCIVRPANCAQSDLTRTCVEMPSGGTAELAAPGTSLRTIRLRQLPTAAECQIEELSGASASAPGTLTNLGTGIIELKPVNTATLTIKSFVVYGAK